MQALLENIRKKLLSFRAAVFGKGGALERGHEGGSPLKVYDANDPFDLLQDLSDSQSPHEVSFTAEALAQLLEGVRTHKIVILEEGVGSPDDRQWPALGAEGVFLLAFESGIFEDSCLLKEGLAFESKPYGASEFESYGSNFSRRPLFSKEVHEVLSSIIKGPHVNPKDLREVGNFTPLNARWALREAAESPRQEMRRAARMLSLPIEERMSADLLKRITEAEDSVYSTFLVLLKDEEEACQGAGAHLTQDKVECRLEQAQALT